MRIFIHIMLLTLASAFTASAAGVSSPEAITATLEQQLSGIRNPADSILIMQNIFDLSLKYRPAVSDSIAEAIYRTARNADNSEVALDMLRQRANFNVRSDSMLQVLRQRAVRLAKSPDRDETVAFIDMQRNSYFALNLDDEQRRTRFHEELEQYTLRPPHDPYERIVLLHSVCVNMAREMRGEFLTDYMGRLSAMIDSLPSKSHALRNTYYVQAAIHFSRAGYPEKSLEADRKLLCTIDTMEMQYAAAGRPYRYYDAHRYIIYTRMLGNWSLLTPEQIEDYYRKAIHFRNNDRRAHDSYARSPRPDIYYAMAQKDYPTALCLLKECIDYPENSTYRRTFLKYLFEAGRAMGDNQTAMRAADEYFTLIEKELDSRINERYKELQVIYDVYEMQREYDRLDAERESNERAWHVRIIYISAAFILIMALLMLLLVRNYRRTRRLAASLAQSNATLMQERDHLRHSQLELTKARDHAMEQSNIKSDFIRNLNREVTIPLQAISEYTHLIVDCTDVTGKPYIQHYASLVTQNCALLQSIAADVIHMAEIDSDTLEIHPQQCDLFRVAQTAVDTAASQLGRHITITFDENSPHIDTFTDPHRLQQVLLNLLSNAAKFTAEGSVTVALDYADADRAKCRITVTDTGIGVPPEQAEHIFGRFVKLDKESQGVGLGLTISRQLTRLLGGDLVLDTHYRHGARFIVTLPLKH